MVSSMMKYAKDWRKNNMDKDFELQYKDKQIAELRSIIVGTITETGSYNPLEGKWEINTSSILTQLIQEAGRWCEHYASDLFVHWKYLIEQKLDNGTLETDTFVFAMYGSGVHHKEWYEKRKYNNYRAVWFLDVETNEGKIKMTLHK